jgi:hypothetical protein
LRVPFSEKGEAKRRGARWDGERKTWYIPEGVEGAAFERWLPTPESPNIRAPGWSLVGSQRECWRCEELSPVFAILLPPGHEALMVEDDPEDDHWERGDGFVLLSYVDAVPASVAAQLHRNAPRYRIDYSQTNHRFYRMNHCVNCESKLGDFETLEESGTFQDLHAALNDRKLTIERLHPFNEPFSARCGGYATVG